jgi:hypothetical protein
MEKGTGVDGPPESMVIGDGCKRIHARTMVTVGKLPVPGPLNDWKDNREIVKIAKVKNGSSGTVQRRRDLIKCGRGSSRQYDKYWKLGRVHANLSKGQLRRALRKRVHTQLVNRRKSHVQRIRMIT